MARPDAPLIVQPASAVSLQAFCAARGTAFHTLFDSAGEFVASARWLGDGAARMLDTPHGRSQVGWAVLDDVRVLDCHFPFDDELLVHQAMHHNADHRIGRFFGADGSPLFRTASTAAGACTRVPGVSCLIGGNDNLWHFIYNCVLRLAVLRATSAGADAGAFTYAVSPHVTPGLVEVLRHLGIPSDRILALPATGAVRFDRLLVAEMPFCSWGGIPWGSPEACRLLFPAAAPSTPRGDRIYISRGDARWRRVLNEDELVAMLRADGFRVVRLTDMSWPELASMMARADVVVGASGGNLAATAHCRPGTLVVELSHRRMAAKYHFHGSSAAHGLRHVKVIGPPQPGSEPFQRWNFNVAMADVRTALEPAGFN